MADLIHELVFAAAERTPGAEALVYQDQCLCYAALAGEIETRAGGMRALGLTRGERVAVYLEKRLEAVIALFAASAAGGVFVPVNPVLKPGQVAHILIDCNVRIFVTSAERLMLLQEILPDCHDLHSVIVVDTSGDLPVIANRHVIPWQAVHAAGRIQAALPVIDSDMAAIIYTSGSTGKPKGVVLSHRNLLAGTKSVAQYLGNRPEDRILTVLPLSFDYGLNQLTTTFYAGAANILMNYLLPRDIIQIVNEQQITGLAAVPPLWIQLAQLDWHNTHALRYITNSGGAMPHMVLEQLHIALPKTQIFLMYGFTEAFRSTYLSPEQLERRPDSIGKPVPNAEVLVLREDGSHCVPGEPGELVHRGALVAMGYWNDPEKTALSFRPLKTGQGGLPMAEIAAWSGDTVQMDDEGYLYFIERRDAMIKTSGYRVSPTEVEEVIYASGLVTEAVAIGVPHPVLGQSIAVIVVPRKESQVDAAVLIKACRQHLPSYMVPGHVEVRHDQLPRNPNGKIDRKLLAVQLQQLLTGNDQ